MTSDSVPVLTKGQIARSIKGKTSKPVKNVLCTPYKVVWPSVDGPTQEAILGELKRSFNERNLKNPLARNAQYKRLKKDERQKRKDEFLAESQQSPEDISIRHQLVFGVTEITRALEKNELRLVVVDRSSPWQLHRHLAQLSAVRGCPAVALDRVSDTLSSLVSVTKMCALGFKTTKDGDSDFFDQTVRSIGAKCPAIEIPWLNCEDVLMAVKCEAASLEEKKVEKDSNRENQSSADTMEKPVNAQKDFSHLYIKKSSLISQVRIESKVLNKEWLLDDTAALDDMWGTLRKKLRRNKLLRSQLGDDASAQTEETKSKEKSTKNRKRAYCGLNIENVNDAKKKK